MRILQINKFGWPKGGSEIYMLRLAAALADRPECEVGMFAGAPVDPVPSVSVFPVVIPSFHEVEGLGRAKAAAHVVWSPQMSAALDEVLREFRPDVAHLHLYAHQMSPSIISLLRRRGIPMVTTAHDLKLVCPAYVGVRRGHDCVRCSVNLSLVPIRDRCLHGSRSWTATALAETALVRSRKLVPEMVIAPSRHFLDIFEHSWMAGRVRLRLLRNPASPTGLRWHGRGGYILFVGRLSVEKGLEQLIRWVASAKLPLVVAGDGPEADALARVAAESGAVVTFEGHVGEERLRELRAGCRAQVMPSSVPENAPLAALEAAVDGVPVILARRGGMPEILEMGAWGAVLDPPTEEGFLAALRDLDRNHGDLDALRRTLDLDAHCDALMEMYRELVARA